MKKQKICLIGNNGGEHDTYGGQTLKVRLYEEILKNEGVPFVFIDLYGWIKKPFRIIDEIRKSIKTCDTILLMAGANGCRKILPIVNYLNRKAKKRIVVSMIGRGVLAISLDKNKINSDNFFLNHNYGHFKDNKMKKNLLLCDAVVLETDILTKTYSDFFGLTNCFTISNFRYFNEKQLVHSADSDEMKIIFLSRVREDKGVFDAINALKGVPSNAKVSLSIYGELEMSENEKKKFFNAISLDERVSYKGEIVNQKVIETISKYDYFLFPTHCSEGMPGVLIESLLAGTPVISSRFTQVHDILKEGEDSILFNVCDVSEMSNIINDLYLHRDKREKMSNFAVKNSKKFTYLENRKKLFEILKIDL